MKKLCLLKNNRNLLLAVMLCLISTTFKAQVTVAQIREQIKIGECETAQSLYNVYKAQENKTNYDLEMQIKNCLDNKNTEVRSNWREEEVRSEILIKTVSIKKFSIYKQGNQFAPSEMELYNRVWSDLKRDYPNRMIGIRRGSWTAWGTYKGWWYQGTLRDDYTDYICDLECEILEPNIRYYLNEAIRSANDGSRIALNQVMFMGGADESLENQLMDILFDEGFRVVNSISNADYYINVKMDDNSLTIRMVNAVTGEYEGVSSVKYEGFIDGIKVGKGGIVCDEEKCSGVIVQFKTPGE